MDTDKEPDDASGAEDDSERVAGIQLRLQRLWKGTLFVGVGGAYVLLVFMLFIYQGWRPALLALFFIGLSQFFRYIANDVDHIGWRISRDKQFDEATSLYQFRMFYLMVGLIQSLNVALLIQAYSLAGFQWLVGCLVLLTVVETLFGQIRKVNRKVEFEQASYGLRDRGALMDGPDRHSESDVDRKLNKLKSMADSGEISQSAYEKTRDAYRIQEITGREVKISLGSND
jgi:hypothetical protein